MSASSTVRCGWAWSTPYAGTEARGGIDELGFISDEAMLSELASWQAMVVPILRSTGVNTKVLPALEGGVPIVLTTVAASPLGVPTEPWWWDGQRGKGSPEPPRQGGPNQRHQKGDKGDGKSKGKGKDKGKNKGAGDENGKGKGGPKGSGKGK